jgi:hypothetical protein
MSKIDLVPEFSSPKMDLRGLPTAFRVYTGCIVNCDGSEEASAKADDLDGELVSLIRAARNAPDIGACHKAQADLLRFLGRQIADMAVSVADSIVMLNEGDSLWDNEPEELIELVAGVAIELGHECQC